MGGQQLVPTHLCDRLCQTLTAHAQGLGWGMTSKGAETSSAQAQGCIRDFSWWGAPQSRGLSSFYPQLGARNQY